jgi:hypothetical protein
MYRILIPILLSLFVVSSALAVTMKLSQQGKLLSSDKSALYGGNNFTPPTTPVPNLSSPGGWHVVSNGSRFLVQYVDTTTTRVTKLDAGSSHVQVVVRTYGD